MAECDPPAEVAAIVADLLARKAVTRELGSALLPRPIAGFLDAEFAAAREAFPSEPVAISTEARAEAAAFFRESVRRFA
jgi:hypothetical protein